MRLFSVISGHPLGKSYLSAEKQSMYSIPLPDWENQAIVNKKKRTGRIVDFAIPADPTVKLKESEKRDKYPNLAREVEKKLRNINVTVIPLVIGTLGTLNKQLVQRPEDLEIKLQHCCIRTKYFEES